jgi:hypothetical protein
MITDFVTDYQFYGGWFSPVVSFGKTGVYHPDWDLFNPNADLERCLKESLPWQFWVLAHAFKFPSLIGEDYVINTRQQWFDLVSASPSLQHPVTEVYHLLVYNYFESFPPLDLPGAASSLETFLR